MLVMRPRADRSRRRRDERAARRDLRDQIARLERELARTLAAAFPRREPARSGRSASAQAGPRLLDARATRAHPRRVRRPRADPARAGTGPSCCAQMRRAPERHRSEIVTSAELGEPGCNVWQVRPWLGPIGMLMGWWRVAASWGCPLAGALRRPVAQASPLRAVTPLATRRAGALPHAACPAQRCATRRERPRAPWHPFPLVELSVLIGLVLLVWGLIRYDDAAGRVLLVCGMALASLGSLETALREHFGGYRSHALLIAALPAGAGGRRVVLRPRALGSPLSFAFLAVLGLSFTGLRRAFRGRG